MLGATHNAGQTCFNMKRIYIHDTVYDAVRDELVTLAQTVKVGSPFDPSVSIGPVQNRGQYERLRFVALHYPDPLLSPVSPLIPVRSGLISDCKEKGYKIAFESRVPASGKGYYVPLVIVDNPPDESRIVREERTYSYRWLEAFRIHDRPCCAESGPIIPLMKWSDDDDVVRRASTCYEVVLFRIAEAVTCYHR